MKKLIICILIIMSLPTLAAFDEYILKEINMPGNVCVYNLEAGNNYSSVVCSKDQITLNLAIINNNYKQSMAVHIYNFRQLSYQPTSINCYVMTRDHKHTRECIILLGDEEVKKEEAKKRQAAKAIEQG